MLSKHYFVNLCFGYFKRVQIFDQPWRNIYSSMNEFFRGCKESYSETSRTFQAPDKGRATTNLRVVFMR